MDKLLYVEVMAGFYSFQFLLQLHDLHLKMTQEVGLSNRWSCGGITIRRRRCWTGNGFQGWFRLRSFGNKVCTKTNQLTFQCLTSPLHASQQDTVNCHNNNNNNNNNNGEAREGPYWTLTRHPR